MNSKIKDANADFLFQAILQLESIEECYQFFEDLCTVSEIKALSQRIVVAKMLSDKRVYSDIVAATGANINEIDHKREDISSEVNSCVVSMVLETRNEAHVAEIIEMIRGAGYTVLN